MDRHLPILTRQRAARVADRAEDCSCSAQTIYRDVEVLCETHGPSKEPTSWLINSFVDDLAAGQTCLETVGYYV